MMPHRSIFARVSFALLWVFVFSLPSEKIVEFANFGTLTRLIGVIAVAGAVFTLLADRNLRVPSVFHAAAAAFIVWSVVSVRWSVQPDYTIDRANTYVQLLTFAYLLWQFAPNMENVHRLLAAYVLGTFVPVCDSAVRYLSGRQTYYQRFATTGFDPNDMALVLALSLPLSYFLWLRTPGARRWIYAVQMIAVCIGILLTTSRGGLIASTVALSIIVWTRAELTRRLRIGLAAFACVTVVTALLVVPATSWERLATLGSEISAGTLNNRTVIWKAGWEAFSNSPFLGVGAGAFPQSLVDTFGHPRGFTPVAHNSYVSVLVETGVIGFGLFLTILSILLIHALRMERVERSLWLTMLAVWSVGVLSLTWEQNKPTWFVFSGLIATAYAGRHALVETWDVPSAADSWSAVAR